MDSLDGASHYLLRAHLMQQTIICQISGVLVYQKCIPNLLKCRKIMYITALTAGDFWAWAKKTVCNGKATKPLNIWIQPCKTNAQRSATLRTICKHLRPALPVSSAKTSCELHMITVELCPWYIKPILPPSYNCPGKTQPAKTAPHDLAVSILKASNKLGRVDWGGWYQ